MLKQLRKLLKNGTFTRIDLDSGETLYGILVDIDGENFNIIQSEPIPDFNRIKDLQDDCEQSLESLGFDGFFEEISITDDRHEERKIVEGCYKIEDVSSIKFDVCHEITVSQLEVMQYQRPKYMPEKSPAKTRNKKVVTKRNAKKSSAPLTNSQVFGKIHISTKEDERFY